MTYRILKPGRASFKLLDTGQFYEVKKRSMTNLKLQTVYVPVAEEPAMGHVVWYGDTYDTNVQKLNNRIVLTPGELSNLLFEFLTVERGETTASFLKSKGIIL